MEHNQQVLTSQEHAMKEYLRRQQVEAEKHIRHHSPAMARRGVGPEPSASMPGTPLNLRKMSHDEVGQAARRLQEEHQQARLARGGSLERYSPQLGRRERGVKAVGCETDAEYCVKTPGSPKPGLNSKSLPKRTSTSQLNYGLLLGQIQQKRAQRKNKSVDGSVSDSNYSSYSEIQGLRGGSRSPHQWLQPSSIYGGWSSAQEENLGSTDSLNSISSSIKQARANSLVSYQSTLNTPHMLQEETEYYGVPFLLQKPLSSGLPSSQPTSPTHPAGHRHSAGQPSLNYSSLPSYSVGKAKPPNDLPVDLNGSSASLISTGSSIYSSQEDKTAADILKLQRELAGEHKKVQSLTTQLSTNAHVVSAFEQSLANMTARLQQITKTAERKDSEVAELRHEIRRLRQSGADAGLCKQPGRKESTVTSPHALLRQVSSSSVNSLSSAHSNSSLNSGDEGKASSKGMKKGWLRSSFSKVLGKGKQRHKSGSVSDCEREEVEVRDRREIEQEDQSGLEEQPSTSRSDKDTKELDPAMVAELKRQLIEKDTLLTETRLEALSSVHKLESLKETVNMMKTELVSLRQDNEKLAVANNSKSIGSSNSSLNTSHDTHNEGSPKRTSVAMSYSSLHSTTPSSLDMSATTDPGHQDSKALSVLVQLEGRQVKVGTVAASSALSWALLDSLMERLLTEYFMRLDPVSNLGLGAESLLEYRVGEVTRLPHHQPEPELLPYGYVIGEVQSVALVLRGRGQGEVDSLALATLVPRSIVQRYLGLLREHRRLVISGPPATGKSTLARGLAELVTRAGGVHSVTLTSAPEQVAAALEEVRQAKPEVLLVDDLQAVEGLEELLGELGSLAPTVVATLSQAGAVTTDLQLRSNFRWILLAQHVEPVRGFLARHLRSRSGGFIIHVLILPVHLWMVKTQP